VLLYPLKILALNLILVPKVWQNRPIFFAEAFKDEGRKEEKLLNAFFYYFNEGNIKLLAKQVVSGAV